jgi:DNA-directed RNA polymerase specialized sigma24 family protein
MELLERFAAGDLEAFEALFRAHQKEVYGWVVRIVRDTGIAEDLTVETFWRIYKRASTRPGISVPGRDGSRPTRLSTISGIRAAKPNSPKIWPAQGPPIPPSAARPASGSEKLSRSFLQNIAWWRRWL